MTKKLQIIVKGVMRHFVTIEHQFTDKTFFANILQYTVSATNDTAIINMI